MKKFYLFLLTVMSLMLTKPGSSQSMSNTDNVLTLSNTCINGGMSSGTYNLLMHYSSEAGTFTVNTSVSISLVNGIMAITAPAGTFPTPATTGNWSMPDTYNGDITLSSGSFSSLMFWALDNNYVEQFNCVALPIYFSSFSGSLSGSSVVLNWQTGTEQNLSAIEVYRTSTGSNFYKIGQVTPTGGGSSYSFTDNNPDATNYYRLKMVSSVGAQSNYSITVVVSCSSCHYTPPTPVICPYTISGPDHICNLESPALYSLSSAVPNFNTITWSVDQPYVAALHTYESFDRTKASLLKKNAAGGVTLTATLSGCSNPITRYIAVGTATPVLTATINRCPILDATMSNAPGATSYEWWLTDENTGNSTAYPGSGISKGFQLTSSDVYDVEGTYTNACGTSSQAFAYGFQCGGSLSFANSAVVSMSPNPSAGVVRIGFSTIYQVRVLDAQGVVRKSFSYPGGETNVSVNISGLNNGLYTIQVFDNKIWRSGKVVLNK